MDVGEWLRGLGLGEYEGKFRDNRIDADVLADLSDGDLEKLGLPLGDRKRVLKAIAGLVGPPSAGTKSEPVDAHPPRPPSAERRPITVMFCDLVGSTSLASRLDAEDWRNVVNAYLDEASASVNGFGGHILKKLGDGLMALFGYPRAQENDAERAVRAALTIQRSLAETNARNAGKGAPELSARIGLESGPVVVEEGGEVFGEAPNVAARVQALAEPGSVLVTANVQRQVAGLFVAEEKGAHALKGVPAAVALYRIVRASGGGRRSGARAYPVRRPRGGPRASHEALGARPLRPGPVRADRRRARHRQVAPDRGVPRPPGRDAAHLGRIIVVATPAEHASASGRRMGPAALRRCRDTGQPALSGPRKHSAGDWPRSCRTCAAARSAGRHPVAGGPRRKSRARGGDPAPPERQTERPPAGGRAAPRMSKGAQIFASKKKRVVFESLASLNVLVGSMDDLGYRRVNIAFPAPPDPSRWERFQGWLASSWRSAWWRTAEFALLACVALAIWFGGGDPTLTYWALVPGILFAAAGLFTSIPNRLAAICAFIVVLLLLFVECKFVVEHARARQNESSVATGHAPMTTPPTPSGPATTPPESAPNAPTAAVPSGPTLPKAAPNDPQTQLAVWESVRDKRNELVRALDDIGEALGHWERKIDSTGGEKALSDAIRNAAGRMIHPSMRLEKLPAEYPWMPDLATALAGDSHVDPVMQAARTLADALALSGQEDAEARLVRLRPLEGKLSTEMQRMADWSNTLEQAAEVRIKDLSGVP